MVNLENEEIVVDAAFIEEMNKYRIPDTSKGFIEACSQSCILFSEKMLGIRLYAWQVYFILGLMKIMEETDLEKRQKMLKKFLALTSRQIGKSTAVTVFAIWCAVFNKYPGTIYNNTIAGVVSATDVQARKLLNEIKKIIRVGDRFMAETYQDAQGNPHFGTQFFTKLLDENEANNTTTITFRPWKENVHGEYILKGSKSGSVIKSFPPTSIVLGETLTILIIDEAGKSDKITDEFVDDYASPTTTSTDGMTIYLSTPWVTSGFFYEAATSPHSEYVKVVFTCDAIAIENPTQRAVIQREMDSLHERGLPDTVKRAYFCRFVKGEQTYFNPENVLDAFTDEYQMYSAYQGRCDMGVDFGGQVKSKTVVTISEMDNEGRTRRLFHHAYPVGDDLSLLEDIARWRKDFNIQRTIVDDCPAGDFLTRQMEEKGWDVTRMNFRAEKVKKYGAFRAALNKGLIVSYQDDVLKTEMLAMEFSQGAKQSVIQHAPGYSDDCIDSFVMSAYYYVQDEGGMKFFDYDVPTPEEQMIREGKFVTEKESLWERRRRERSESAYDW